MAIILFVKDLRKKFFATCQEIYNRIPFEDTRALKEKLDSLIWKAFGMPQTSIKG